MDGTLVDSDAAVERSWRVWSAEYGADVERALAISPGRPSLPTVRDLLPGLDEPEVLAAADRQLAIQYDDLSDVVAAPGAHRFLATLERQGLPWVLVTSADRRLAAARLGAAGITASVMVTSEDVHAGKPDPEGYLLAATTLGIDIAVCAVVEDAPAGVEAGRAAGALVIGVRGVEADVTVADLGELASRLDDRVPPRHGEARKG
jgi:sugar-phosphatase